MNAENEVVRSIDAPRLQEATEIENEVSAEGVDQVSGGTVVGAVMEAWSIGYAIGTGINYIIENSGPGVVEPSSPSPFQHGA